MSKEFYDWLETRPDRYAEPYGNEIWDAAIQKMQAKLDAKDKDMESLRRFARSAIAPKTNLRLINEAVTLGLIDESGNPTKLLTGDK